MWKKLETRHARHYRFHRFQEHHFVQQLCHLRFVAAAHLPHVQDAPVTRVAPECSRGEAVA